MWSRLMFWCVFAAFILNILQPGYMQFYDIRKPLFGLVVAVKKQLPNVVVSLPTQSTPQPTPTCPPPTSSYDRILFAQGIGGCNARSN